jgi:sugar/nucleoside kinase (ribokinase family)
MSLPLTSRSGLLAGGNWIVDHVKILDAWPPQDALANILSESWGNGGSPYNLLKDLSRLGAAFPLAGVGLVGDDPDGRRILDDCRNHGIDTTRLLRSPEAATSYSDVMTDGGTGRRTFFHQRGANAHLGPEHFDFTGVAAKIFHLGYLLLLDRLDRLENGRPLASEVLRRARAAGLLTSLDCVSENSDRLRSVAAPALPDVDLLFVNDFEAEKLTGISLRPGGGETIRREAVEATCEALLNLGVGQWVILHFPEAVYAASPRGQRHWQPSLCVPPRMIAGTAGAGDAFASGVLYGIHEAWPMPDALRLGVCAAASSLSHPTCSDGILNADACLQLAPRLGLRPLPT